MAIRSQMRLQQLTGSFGSTLDGKIDDSINSGNAIASSNIAAGDLSEVLSHMAASIRRIHGVDFSNQTAGNFSHALTGSAGLKIDGDADFNSSADFLGAVNLQSTLDVADKIEAQDADFAGAVAMEAGATVSGAELHVDSNLTANSAKIEDLTATRVVFAGTGGELKDSASLVWDGSDLIAASAKVSDLTDNRIVIAGASGALEDDSGFTMDGSTFQLGASIAADFDSTLNVAGESTLASATVSDLTSGRVVLAGTAGSIEDSPDLTFNGSVLSTISGSFSGDVTISGNLTIAGSTTTVNTEEVTIADHNIIIDSNNTTAAVIDGAGFTFEGGLGDDLTFQWLAGSTRMELKLGSNFADLKIKDMLANEITLSDDINAVNGVFSADVSAVNGTFSGNINAVAISGSAGLKIDGDADLNAGLNVSGGESVLSSATVSDLTSGRIVLAGASGELKDDALFTYNSSDIMVGGAGAVVLSSTDDSVEADIFKVASADNQIKINAAKSYGSSLELVTAADHIAINPDSGFIAFENGDTLELGLDMGAANQAMFVLNDNTDALAFISDDGSGNKSIRVQGALPLEFRDADLSINSSVDGQLDIDADNEVEITSTLIDMNGAVTVDGNLSLDGSANELRFYEGANYVGFEAPALSADQIWVLPDADAGGSDYALVSDGAGNLSWKAPAQESSKKYIIEDGATSANTSLATTVDLSAITLARAVHVLDVYVNGQLMKPDLSGGAFVAYTGNVASTADYKLDMSTATASTIKFGFALEADDVVTVIMRA